MKRSDEEPGRFAGLEPAAGGSQDQLGEVVLEAGQGGSGDDGGGRRAPGNGSGSTWVCGVSGTERAQTALGSEVAANAEFAPLAAAPQAEKESRLRVAIAVSATADANNPIQGRGRRCVALQGQGKFTAAEHRPLAIVYPDGREIVAAPRGGALAFFEHLLTRRRESKHSEPAVPLPADYQVEIRDRQALAAA
jgi:hypothetical protein